MLDLNRHVPSNKPLSLLSGYADPVKVPATMLYGMPKAVPDVAMEDYTNKTSGLAEELLRRQENLRFVLKEFKRDFIKAITFDFMLNAKLAKEPYTSLMNVEILNPMGLRAPLLDYAIVIEESIVLCQHIVAKTIPNAKEFFARLIVDDELNNARPMDVVKVLDLNTEQVASLKEKLSKMLDSQYENATTSFGEQFRRIKDWEECNRQTALISKALDDITKHNINSDVKELSVMLDKLILKLKRDDSNKANEANCLVVKNITRAVAEEISFLGAILHLADTLLKVMEDNKEFLRDYLTK